MGRIFSQRPTRRSHHAGREYTPSNDALTCPRPLHCIVCIRKKNPRTEHRGEEYSGKTSRDGGFRQRCRSSILQLAHARKKYKQCKTITPPTFDPQSRLKKVAGSLLVVIPNDQHFAILLRRKLQASAVGAAPFDKLRHLLPVDAGRLKAKLEAGRDAYRRRVRIVRRRVETKREQRALGEGEGARLSAVDGPGAGRDLLTDGEGVAHDFK